MGKAQFEYLAGNIGVPGNIEKARQILVECGALSFCIYQLLHSYTALIKEIDAIDVSKNHLLKKIPEILVEPVRKILKEFGLDEFKLHRGVCITQARNDIRKRSLFADHYIE